MSKANRSHSANKEEGFIHTMHSGFNYFHQIEFRSRNTHRKTTRTRIHTHGSVIQDGHKTLQNALSDNKQKFEKIKTEMQSLRELELNDYIKKSLKYQQLLNINDNKKKRLPTLNSKVGEVVKKSAAQLIPKNIQYQMTSNRYKLEGWKPESRQGHTTTIYKNMAIIVGGHCSYPYSIAQVYSFQNQNWLKQFNISSARSYHSSILYKNRFIIVFGGMGTYDISRKCRVCFNTINLIDLHSWSCRILKMSNEETIQGRRSHAVALMGKYMLVLGGMNTKREYLKDFVYLDLKQLRWYQKEYKIQGKQLNQNMDSGLAKHKIITNFRNTHKNYPLYSSEYNDHQGLLIFGGIYGNGEENIIIHMSFNKYNPVLKKLEYSGIPPSSIEPIIQKINENLLVILSGDQIDRGVKLYRIKEREFVGVYKYMNAPLFGGLGSTLSKYEQDFYVFFGLGDSGYIGNVSSFKIDEKIIENQVKKKKERNFDTVWKQLNSIDSDSLIQ